MLADSRRMRGEERRDRVPYRAVSKQVAKCVLMVFVPYRVHSHPVCTGAVGEGVKSQAPQEAPLV